MQVTTRISRRELTSGILAASASGFLSAKPTITAGSALDTDHMPMRELVRRRIQEAISRGQATGVAVAMVQGGEIVWQEGFGWANRESGKKATPHTPFGMASLTKPFTTTTIMTLAAERKLSLDQPANKYLRDSRIAGTNGNPEAATVRLLGAHASGLPVMYESYEANEIGLRATPDGLLRAYGRLAFPPATWYEYSNIGYAALNAIALALTQTDFGTLLQQRVLGPLGLSDSFFGSDAPQAAEGAVRYDPMGHAIPHYVTSTPASGELYASVHDLARFLLFNMHHRFPGQERVLEGRQIEELHRPVFTGPAGVESTFGWFCGNTPSEIEFLFKTGGDPGVANRMCFVPSKGLGCVVVTNQSNAGELAYNVCDELMASYLPDWRRPIESCGFPETPFLDAAVFRGEWHGRLEDGGANMPIRLKIESNTIGTLSLGNGQAEKMTEMKAEGKALAATSTGQIDSTDAIRVGATKLKIKLLPYDNHLVGRVIAIAGDMNFKNARLPYVVRLSRM